ncbi:hypothetical protein H4R34_005489 [Dimargaris verticillata]|uniref:CUE domain-containing protein n=1 Tax=Dimargaris verticillata TaxID=2761393 RepID=A0A9W8EA76_9FUNG|nr:hypothetical protein H4R34_005489 [Dimargaris verticillata]
MGEISLAVSAVILYFVFKWLLGGDNQSGGQGGASSTGRYTVRPGMVERVHALFPHIPEAAIRADLSRTGSVEVTCDNILQNNGLNMPPDMPNESQTSSPQLRGNTAGTNQPGSSQSVRSVPTDSLVRRYNLADRLDQPMPEAQSYTWETDAAKRQEQLKRRKELMVLQARK